MKKILILILILMFSFVSGETLKAGIDESYVPAGFYGSWGVISKLKNCTNPNLFNYESRDIWTLSAYGDVLVLENVQTGAKSQIIVKEKNKDGKTLKFERQKTVNNQDNKVIYKETITFVLNGRYFSGQDDFVVETYSKDGNLVSKNYANYKVEGTKIAG